MVASAHHCGGVRHLPGCDWIRHAWQAAGGEDTHNSDDARRYVLGSAHWPTIAIARATLAGGIMPVLLLWCALMAFGTRPLPRWLTVRLNRV